MSKKYNWKRQWYPRPSNTSLELTQARLENWLLQTATTPVYFEDIEHIPCLILLGEPGIGKTETLKSEYEKLRNNLAKSVDDTDFIDIEGISSREFLEKTIFDNPKFNSWHEGSHNFTLFLDSVDRSLLPVSTVIKSIAHKLKYVDIKRLKLRIACRDLDWSLSIADELTEVWYGAYKEHKELSPRIHAENALSASIHLDIGDQDQIKLQEGTISSWVQVYQLGPLSIQELIVAAQDNQTVPEDFIKWLNDLGVISLATIPITLECLFRKFREKKLFSKRSITQYDLFLDCSKSLCTRHEQDHGIERVTDVEQHFKIAARLAALMIFTNTYSIVLDDSFSESEAALPLLKTLVLTSEHEEQLVRDTLSTSLFRGTRERRSFVHRAFAEFLAAHFLIKNKVALSTFFEICTTPSGQFAPQLNETIRWLSVGRNDVFKAVIENEPYLLLDMDLSYLTDKEFGQFLHKLLTLDNKYMYVSLLGDLYGQRFRINHPALNKLLSPYLQDKSLKLSFVRTAITRLKQIGIKGVGKEMTNGDNSKREYLLRFLLTMIQRFHIKGLDRELIKFVLDTSESHILRVKAADAIYTTGTPETKEKLRPFIYSRSDDPDDELKGYALLSLWPNLLSVKELFKVLSYPKREHFFGSYSLFLSAERIITPLTILDLPIALQWVKQLPDQHKLPYSFSILLSAIMRKAWDNIQHPQVLEAFAEAALARLLKHDPIWGEDREYPSLLAEPDLKYYHNSFIEAAEKRRQIAEHILPFLSEPKDDFYYLQHFLFREDLDWTIQKLLSSQNDNRIYWAKLIQLMLRQIMGRDFQKTDLNDIVKIYHAHEQNAELAEVTKFDFGIWQLDDPQVLAARERFLKRKHFEEEHQLPKLDPPPLKRIEDSLQKVEEGHVSHWVNVVLNLLLDPARGSVWFDFERDITTFPNWEDCGTAVQAQIVQAAKTYILQQPEEKTIDGNNDTSDWFISGSQVPYIEIMGYLALLLLMHKAPEFINEISQEKWERWSRIVVWYPLLSGIRSDQEEQDHLFRERQHLLLSIIYQKIPATIIEHVVSLLKAENQRHQHIFILHKFQQWWDADIETALINQLSDDTLSAASVNVLLEYLLSYGSHEAKDFIEALIQAPNYEMQKAKVVEATVAWFIYPVEFRWSVIWNKINTNEDFGKAVIERLAYRDRKILAFANQMTADEIANLIIWIEERYPHEEDPQIDGFHQITTREEISYFRYSLVNYLKGLEPKKAKSAIERIADRFPDYDQIQFVKTEVQRVAVENEWTPATAAQVLELEIQKTNSFWRDWSIERKGLAIAILALIVAILQLIVPLFPSNITNNDTLPTPSPIVSPTSQQDRTTNGVVTTKPAIELPTAIETELTEEPQITQSETPSN